MRRRRRNSRAGDAAAAAEAAEAAAVFAAVRAAIAAATVAAVAAASTARAPPPPHPSHRPRACGSRTLEGYQLGEGCSVKGSFDKWMGSMERQGIVLRSCVLYLIELDAFRDG